MTYDDLVSKYGNANRAAKALDLSRQALSRWKKTGIPFPAQYRIQMRTRGRLKANTEALDKRRAA